jgi:hypothetical protein
MFSGPRQLDPRALEEAVRVADETSEFECDNCGSRLALANLHMVVGDAIRTYLEEAGL